MLLLSIGMTAFAPVARAADCAGLGPADDPISSHYTQQVIDRAEAGISHANSFSDVQLDFAIVYFSWLDEISRFVSELVDADLRLNSEGHDLREHTACFFTDLRIIESEMEKVRCMLTEETLTEDSVNPGKAFHLQQVLQFLNERYRHLLEGGLDPTYRDTGWNVNNAFDQDDHTEDDPMCPFHSNYLPPTIYGYGCDSAESDHPSVQDEMDALDTLIEERNEFIEASQDLPELIEQLNWFTGHEMPDLSNFGAGLDREHKEFFGCLEDEESGRGEYREAVDNGESLIYNRGGTTVELRGPFSFEKDEPKIVRRFMELRTLWGASRPQSDELKLPEEFDQEEDPDGFEEAERREKTMSIFEKAIRNVARVFIQNWNLEQSRSETSIIAKSSDPDLQIRPEMQKLRNEMKSLAELASDKGMGARLFSTKLATFLRGSCIYRPCNQQLETVLKLTLTDSCFPYVSGGAAAAEEDGTDISESCIDDAEL